MAMIIHGPFDCVIGYGFDGSASIFLNGTRESHPVPAAAASLAPLKARIAPNNENTTSLRTVNERFIAFLAQNPTKMARVEPRKMGREFSGKPTAVPERLAAMLAR